MATDVSITDAVDVTYRETNQTLPSPYSLTSRISTDEDFAPLKKVSGNQILSISFSDNKTFASAALLSLRKASLGSRHVCLRYISADISWKTTAEVDYNIKMKGEGHDINLGLSTLDFG